MIELPHDARSRDARLNATRAHATSCRRKGWLGLAVASITTRRRSAQTILAGAFALITLFFVQPGTALAMKIQEIRSPGGVSAWLVEEHSVPLIAMRFAFLGGAAQDPDEVPGVANFLTAMLDEGAGDMNAAAFQERQEELAVRMRFEAERDAFVGSFQALSENRAESIELLRLALTKPRFDSDAVERMRQQLLAGLRFDAKDPDKVAGSIWFRTAFEGHPYARPVDGTEDSVSRIGAAELEAYRSKVFARDNLRIAVVGDITAAELGAILDQVFGDLPAKADLRPVDTAKAPQGPTENIIQMDLPQSVVRFGHGSIARNDPDFIPLYVMNYILGGGGFASRLMTEVREKRGLAYSVFSYLAAYDHGSIFLGGVATKNDAVDKSIEVIRTELEHMAKDGPSDEELANAKSYLTGSYALRFDSSAKIADQLLGIQMENLGIDYVEKRNGLIEAVTIEDVRRAATRVLRPGNLIVTIVGNPTRS